MTANSRIGLIGLGKMGEGFCARLAGLGYEVVGYDVDAGKLAAAAARGLKPAASPAEVARAADIVLVCVISTHAVEDVVLGTGGIAEIGGSERKVVVDLSTTEFEATKHIAAALAARCGAAFVDAPVSGGPGAAAEGRLAIMAGGADAAIAAVQPLMEQLGSRFTHMGPVGAGQATKLVNQALVLSNYIVIAEAFSLGKRFGIDVARIPHALGTGYAGGNLLNDLIPRMANDDHAPRGYARQILKDLTMLQDAAKAVNLAMPMASEATTLYRILVGQGKGELDGTAIVTLLDGLPGKS